jgi:hypothetical protein
MRHSAVAVLTATWSLIVPTAVSLAQPKQLNEKQDINRAITDATLGDLVELFTVKHEVRIRVDDAAFKKVGIDQAAGKSIELPRMQGVTLEFVLEAAVQQIGGTVRHDGDEIVIVPGKRNVASALRAPTDGLKKKLAMSIEIKTPIENTRWDDLILFFSEKADVSIVVTDWLFPHVSAKNDAKPAVPGRGVKIMQGRVPQSRLSELPCRLPGGTRTLERWLDDLASQVGGVIIARDNVILVMPAPKDKS